VYLQNTPLTKNQRLRNGFKAVFGKHILRTKYCIFLLMKIKHAKHFLIENEITQMFKPTNKVRKQKNKDFKIKHIFLA
jgi:hypothetical protein